MAKKTREINKLYDIFTEGLFFGKGENVTNNATVIFTQRSTLDQEGIKERIQWIIDYYEGKAQHDNP